MWIVSKHKAINSKNMLNYTFRGSDHHHASLRIWGTLI